MENYLIKTKRLGLRFLQESDIKYLEALEGDAEVKKYFPDGPRDRNKTEDMIKRFISNRENKGLPNFLIFDLESGEFIGRVGFGLTEDNEIEVGYVLHKNFWGKGIASEALSAMLAYAKENIKTDYIIAYADEGNVGSTRVMEKCGMQYYKTGIAKGIQCRFYKIKNKMPKRNKEKVYESYEEIVDWFDDARTKTLMESEYLNLILNSIPANSSILDLGCGTGEPIAQFFIDKGFKITGVDGSKKMIEVCKKRFPTHQWIVSDMRDIHLNQQFEVVLAWHSFFHLDQDSQRKIFKLFAEHCKSKGILAFTSGEEEGEVWSDNGGEMLYHASLSTNEYEKLLKENSFEVLIHKIRDPHCGEATVWVAQKV